MADDRATLDALLSHVDTRLSQILAPFIADLTRRVTRAGNRSTIGTPGRLGLSQWLTGALGDLFGATPAEAEGLYATPGTVPHLLAAALRASARVAVAPAIADLTKRLAGQPALLAAVTGPSGNPRPPLFDPARLWIDPNGHRLSDRVWQSGEDIRARIDGLLDYHIQRGTTATETAQALESFLTPQGAASRTALPYGTQGSYSARRLARTEVTRAYGSATTEAARANPFVAGLRWRLSASHPKMDQCDQRAGADTDGLGKGVYRVDNVPRYPDHPQCKCSLIPVTRQDSAAVIAALARGEAPGGLDAGAIVSAVGGF